MFGKVINIRAECYVSPSSFRFFRLGRYLRKRPKPSVETSQKCAADCVLFKTMFPVFEDACTQLLT